MQWCTYHAADMDPLERGQPGMGCPVLLTNGWQIGTYAGLLSPEELHCYQTRKPKGR